MFSYRSVAIFLGDTLLLKFCLLGFFLFVDHGFWRRRGEGLWFAGDTLPVWSEGIVCTGITSDALQTLLGITGCAAYLNLAPLPSID